MAGVTESTLFGPGLKPGFFLEAAIYADFKKPAPRTEV
jgi:hypothetical protein